MFKPQTADLSSSQAARRNRIFHEMGNGEWTDAEGDWSHGLCHSHWVPRVNIAYQGITLLFNFADPFGVFPE